MEGKLSNVFDDHDKDEYRSRLRLAQEIVADQIEMLALENKMLEYANDCCHEKDFEAFYGNKGFMRCKTCKTEFKI